VAGVLTIRKKMACDEFFYKNRIFANLKGYEDKNNLKISEV